MSGFINGYYTFCIWVTRFAYLNLLWIFFTIVGLGALGFFPATAAMFSVVRKWVTKKDEVSIFKIFWKVYRTEFIKSNILGYILLLVGYFLYIELQILQTQEGLMYFIASLIIISTFVLYFIIVIYLFPIFVHFELKTFQYIKWAFIIGVVHPILTVVLGVGLAGLHYLIITFSPALLLFFGGSIPAYLLMKGAHLTFSKYEGV